MFKIKRRTVDVRQWDFDVGSDSLKRGNVGFSWIFMMLYIKQWTWGCRWTRTYWSWLQKWYWFISYLWLYGAKMGCQ